MWQPLRKTSRYLTLLIAALLALLYFVPLWSIHLAAPQYPEGLGMYLWIHKITGLSPFDLQNINLLNHYIGMDPIIEQSIPEFQYMPSIVGFMIAGAVVAAAIGRRIMIYLGLANLTLIGAAGLYDFWQWEYNYGHHLNPDAPISIPGMTYQPPLIGCKQLLNITSCSWPHVGGIILFVVATLLVSILWVEHRGDRRG
ncbi:MAG: hypothetical protein HY540_01320 [Deltaproteobacteria bacterium]|nr:hypothetical protein [Deltaproteobacteria bacterium]